MDKSQDAPAGPGDELKRILSSAPFFISASPGCSCDATASLMNAYGASWCLSEPGMERILASMKASAASMGIPYLETVARALIRRAVHAHVSRGVNVR